MSTSTSWIDQQDNSFKRMWVYFIKFILKTWEFHGSNSLRATPTPTWAARSGHFSFWFEKCYLPMSIFVFLVFLNSFDVFGRHRVVSFIGRRVISNVAHFLCFAVLFIPELNSFLERCMFFVLHLQSNLHRILLALWNWVCVVCLHFEKIQKKQLFFFEIITLWIFLPSQVESGNLL